MNDLTAYYIIAFLPLIVTMIAQSYVKNAYSKYGKIPSSTGYTGAAVARDILDRNGMGSVEIKRMKGTLTDRYDPRDASVYLSNGNHDSNSIAAIAVSAHECGHAMQHRDSYAFLNVRSAMLPLVSISSYGGYLAIMMGMFMNAINLIWIGIAMEVVILLFQVITLPVEFDASSRALVQIQNNGYLQGEEIDQAKKVLNAAALTYVASVAATFFQIVRLVVSFGGKRNNRS
ncbi:MAG: zinc metallopeptidase [Erysipelotrichaceae bacterium]|nr:zinc metallopeptidase [Erysipelotrichaceae bacterium]